MLFVLLILLAWFFHLSVQSVISSSAVPVSSLLPSSPPTLDPRLSVDRASCCGPASSSTCWDGGSEEAQWSGKWEARDSGNAHPASTLRNRGPRCSCSINPLLRLLSFMLLGAGPSKMHELQDTFGNSSPFELVFIFRWWGHQLGGRLLLRAPGSCWLPACWASHTWLPFSLWSQGHRPDHEHVLPTASGGALCEEGNVACWLRCRGYEKGTF